MPKEGGCVQFKTWKNTVRHPFVIYADFEAILAKTDEKKGENTQIFQKREAMSYGFLVKASDDVPAELLDEHDIPTGPVIYRGGEEVQDVAKHFVAVIVEASRKIDNFMKTNIPLLMTKDQEKTYQESIICNLCKCSLTGGDKARDHDYLTGKCRQTWCS
uniref:Uncharacterized protein n=1 Tax=Schizaphis graminum TaxID=13262 RepID=A0A2S2NA27_SCHGA